MGATVAATARPANAAVAWVQDDRLFVELPTKSGTPYVIAYKRTLEGLTAALNILIENSEALPPSPQTSVGPHPSVRKVASFSEDQREAARRILKKMGIT